MKKEKLLITLGIALFFSLSQFETSAQQFRKGDLMINAGLGFGYFYTDGLPGHSGLPVGVTGNVEYSIFDEISIGGYIAFTRGKYDDYYFNNRWETAHYSSFDIGARGSFHFAKLMRLKNKQFDPYASALLGFTTRSVDGRNDYDDTWIRPGVVAGARWFFSPGFGAYAEAGYGVHSLTLGLTFRL